jgi:hypothetical protein
MSPAAVLLETSEGGESGHYASRTRHETPSIHPVAKWIAGDRFSYGIQLNVRRNACGVPTIHHRRKKSCWWLWVDLNYINNLLINNASFEN